MSVDEQQAPKVLWSLAYQQHLDPWGETSEHGHGSDRVLEFLPSSLDLVFDDAIIEDVKRIWQKIMGEDATDFLVFEEREGLGAEMSDDD